MMNSSSSNNISGVKRKHVSTNFYYQSDVFEGNNVGRIKKVESGPTVNNDASKVIDLTYDTDEDEHNNIPEQQSINVDFIREYWWVEKVTDQELQKAADVNLLVSTYIYAAKARSLCSDAIIKRFKYIDENTGDLLAIDNGCIHRLEEDIGIIDKANARLHDQWNQEDEVLFRLAKQ